MTRLPLRVSEVAAIIVALVIGYVVTSHVGIVQTDDRPFVRSGTAGHTVHLSYADVRVLGVRASKYLAVDPNLAGNGVHVVKPAGIFVLVLAELTPTRQPMGFPGAWLLDDQGREYRTSEKSTCDVDPLGVTGQPVYTMYCFEVPPDRLDQLHIEIARADDQDLGTRDDDVADVDLGITPATARELAATTTTYRAAQSSPTPIRLKTVTIKDAS